MWSESEVFFPGDFLLKLNSFSQCPSVRRSPRNELKSGGWKKGSSTSKATVLLRQGEEEEFAGLRENVCMCRPCVRCPAGSTLCLQGIDTKKRERRVFLPPRKKTAHARLTHPFSRSPCRLNPKAYSYFLYLATVSCMHGKKLSCMNGNLCLETEENWGIRRKNFYSRALKHWFGQKHQFVSSFH